MPHGGIVPARIDARRFPDYFEYSVA